MKYFNLIICILFSVHGFSQNFISQDPNYITNVKQGEAALNDKAFESCLDYYETAFKIKHTSTLSTMRAAACAFGASKAELLEYYLDTAFNLSLNGPKSTFYNMPEFQPFYDSDLEVLIKDKWEARAIEAGLNLELITELEEIGKSDQEQRAYMREFSEKYGWKSPQMDSLWAIQNVTDERNTNRIKEIIKAHGYPGKTLVGDGLSSTAFLVIQHADSETQNEYLPILRAAADAGEMRWRSLALLIDRVNLGNGEAQIYGSQIHTDQVTGEYYFGKIQDPFKVDSLRESVGLGSLQEYGDNWNLTWDPVKHIDRHKRIMAEKLKKEEKK